MAGEGPLHQPGREPVLEESRDDALIDEERLARDGPFVVDVVGTAGGGDGRVVVDRDLLRADPLPHLVPEDGRFLAVEIGLEEMADGFVDEDAAVAGGEDDGHLAGRGVDGVEEEDGLARRPPRRSGGASGRP